MCAPPATRDFAKAVSVPFSLLTQPFANVENGEEPIMKVDMNNGQPLRCNRCKGYVNSYVVWMEEGNTWMCNLCTMVNPVPAW